MLTNSSRLWPLVYLNQAGGYEILVAWKQLECVTENTRSRVRVPGFSFDSATESLSEFE